MTRKSGVVAIGAAGRARDEALAARKASGKLRDGVDFAAGWDEAIAYLEQRLISSVKKEP